mmetsp:Transcript_48815/g.114023  ORF Transcript_48815/g.114023 Transcript_48815/m.114023 type:complete len:396 (+) Transcript_48815:52-1239(+)
MGAATSVSDGGSVSADAYWRDTTTTGTLGATDAYKSYTQSHVSPLAGRYDHVSFEPRYQPELPSPGLVPNLRGPTLQTAGLPGSRDVVYGPCGSASGDGRWSPPGPRFLPPTLPKPGREFAEAPFHQKFSRLDYNADSDLGMRLPSSSFSYKAEALGHSALPLPGSFPGKPFPLLIFDWDDTLMCSSAINANDFLPHQYGQLESLVEQVLLTALRLGETCIVTNADELWVTESSRRYIPRVLPILSRMPVVSARRRFERAWPGDVFAWKREAFRQVLSSWQANALASGGIHLIVLGDSIVEMEAAHTSSAGLVAPTAVKTVKFKEVPTVDDVLDQLTYLNQELGAIVADDKSSYRNLAAKLGGVGTWSLAGEIPDTAYGTMSMQYSPLGVPLSVP